MPLKPIEGFQRMLAVPRRTSNGVKTAVLFGILALLGVLVALYDRTPSLSHVRVKFLSGAESGNYYAIVNRLASEVNRRRGRIQNIASSGSVDNITRLVVGHAKCDVQFALVQDGMAWPEGSSLELVGRLSHPESLVILGREADQIHSLSDLRGKRIGIGPVGSGTERVARQIVAELSDLNLQVFTQSIDQQLAMLQRGELDLGAMVIDENSKLLTEAVRDRGLQIMNLPGADVLAHRLPFARSGIIPAGNYDPVRQLPAEDKHVLQIDTLVVGNGCASWSATQGMLSALTVQFPDFVHVNRERTNRTGLPFAPAARAFIDNDGPDAVGVHAPWLVDLLPTASWLQLIFGFSLLFNAMAFAHRYRLWRIDARRVNVESEIPALFSPGITVGEIASAPVDDRQKSPEVRAKLDEIIGKLVELLDRCRKYSVSVLVPMGQEMNYRYQEALISDLLSALRSFRARLTQAND